MGIHNIRHSEIGKIAKRPGMHGDGGKLWLQVTPKGSASWLYRFRQNARARAIGLGPLHTVGLDDAREIARKLRKAELDGRDPKAELLAIRASNAQDFDTVKEAFFEKSKKPLVGWKSMLDRYASPVIGKKPVDLITSEDIMTIIGPIWCEKVETASKLRSRIECVLDVAAGGHRNDNPARWKGVLSKLLPSKKDVNPEHKHLPSMPYADVPAFMPKLRAREGDIAALALEFVIFTAVRTGDLNGQPAKPNKPAKPALHWKHLDEGDRTWEIGKTKNGRSHEVALSDAALDVLARVKRLKLDGDIVFPIEKEAMRNLMIELAPDFTVHGFRSSFQTWADEVIYAQNDVIDTCLSHKIVGDEVKKAYRRGSFFEKRCNLMASWANYLNGTGANVVALKRPELADSALEVEPKRSHM